MFNQKCKWRTFTFGFKHFHENCLFKWVGTQQNKDVTSFLNDAHLNELSFTVVIWLDQSSVYLSRSQLESQQLLF